MGILKSFSFFIIAGLCEIGGSYLIWLWLKEGKSFAYGIFGAVIIVLYGVIATFQPANFGRAFATYGGVFILLSVFWGWKVDNVTPDKFDIIGLTFVIIGSLIMMYFPRS